MLCKNGTELWLLNFLYPGLSILLSSSRLVNTFATYDNEPLIKIVYLDVIEGKNNCLAC